MRAPAWVRAMRMGPDIVRVWGCGKAGGRVVPPPVAAAPLPPRVIPECRPGRRQPAAGGSCRFGGRRRWRERPRSGSLARVARCGPARRAVRWPGPQARREGPFDAGRSGHLRDRAGDASWRCSTRSATCRCSSGQPPGSTPRSGGICRKSDPSGSDRNSSGLDPAAPSPGSAPVQVPPVARRRVVEELVQHAAAGGGRGAEAVAGWRRGIRAWAAVAVWRRAAAVVPRRPRRKPGPAGRFPTSSCCAMAGLSHPHGERSTRIFTADHLGPRIRLKRNNVPIMFDPWRQGGDRCLTRMLTPPLRRPLDHGPGRRPAAPVFTGPFSEARISAPPGGFVRNLHPRSTDRRIPQGPRYDRSRRPLRHRGRAPPP